MPERPRLFTEKIRELNNRFLSPKLKESYSRTLRLNNPRLHHVLEERIRATKLHESVEFILDQNIPDYKKNELIKQKILNSLDVRTLFNITYDKYKMLSPEERRYYDQVAKYYFNIILGILKRGGTRISVPQTQKQTSVGITRKAQEAEELAKKRLQEQAQRPSIGEGVGITQKQVEAKKQEELRRKKLEEERQKQEAAKKLVEDKAKLKTDFRNGLLQLLNKGRILQADLGKYEKALQNVLESASLDDATKYAEQVITRLSTPKPKPASRSDHSQTNYPKLDEKGRRTIVDPRRQPETRRVNYAGQENSPVVRSESIVKYDLKVKEKQEQFRKSLEEKARINLVSDFRKEIDKLIQAGKINPDERTDLLTSLNEVIAQDGISAGLKHAQELVKELNARESSVEQVQEVKTERPSQDPILLSEVEPIAEQESVEVRSKSDLKHIVELPLLKACELFYDLNIETVTSSANKSKNIAYIGIAWKTLSSENYEIARKLGGVISDTLHGRNKMVFSIPLSGKETVQEISDKFLKIVKQFKKQKLAFGYYKYTLIEFKSYLLKNIFLLKLSGDSELKRFYLDLAETKKYGNLKNPSAEQLIRIMLIEELGLDSTTFSEKDVLQYMHKRGYYFDKTIGRFYLSEELYEKGKEQIEPKGQSVGISGAQKAAEEEAKKRQEATPKGKGVGISEREQEARKAKEEQERKLEVPRPKTRLESMSEKELIQETLKYNSIAGTTHGVQGGGYAPYGSDNNLRNLRDAGLVSGWNTYENWIFDRSNKNSRQGVLIFDNADKRQQKITLNGVSEPIYSIGKVCSWKSWDPTDLRNTSVSVNIFLPKSIALEVINRIRNNIDYEVEFFDEVFKHVDKTIYGAKLNFEGKSLGRVNGIVDNLNPSFIARNKFYEDFPEPEDIENYFGKKYSKPFEQIRITEAQKRVQDATVKQQTEQITLQSLQTLFNTDRAKGHDKIDEIIDNLVTKNTGLDLVKGILKLQRKEISESFWSSLINKDKYSFEQVDSVLKSLINNDIRDIDNCYQVYFGLIEVYNKFPDYVFNRFVDLLGNDFSVGQLCNVLDSAKEFGLFAQLTADKKAKIIFILQEHKKKLTGINSATEEQLLERVNKHLDELKGEVVTRAPEVEGRKPEVPKPESVKQEISAQERDLIQHTLARLKEITGREFALTLPEMVELARTAKKNAPFENGESLCLELFRPGNKFLGQIGLQPYNRQHFVLTSQDRNSIFVITDNIIYEQRPGRFWGKDYRVKGYYSYHSVVIYGKLLGIAFLDKDLKLTTYSFGEPEKEEPKEVKPEPKTPEPKVPERQIERLGKSISEEQENEFVDAITKDDVDKLASVLDKETDSARMLDYLLLLFRGVNEQDHPQSGGFAFRSKNSVTKFNIFLIKLKEIYQSKKFNDSVQDKLKLFLIRHNVKLEEVVQEHSVPEPIVEEKAVKPEPEVVSAEPEVIIPDLKLKVKTPEELISSLKEKLPEGIKQKINSALETRKIELAKDPSNNGLIEIEQDPETRGYFVPEGLLTKIRFALEENVMYVVGRSKDIIKVSPEGTVQNVGSDLLSSPLLNGNYSRVHGLFILTKEGLVFLKLGQNDIKISRDINEDVNESVESKPVKSADPVVELKTPIEERKEFLLNRLKIAKNLFSRVEHKLKTEPELVAKPEENDLIEIVDEDKKYYLPENILSDKRFELQKDVLYVIGRSELTEIDAKGNVKTTKINPPLPRSVSREHGMFILTEKGLIIWRYGRYAEEVKTEEGRDLLKIVPREIEVKPARKVEVRIEQERTEPVSDTLDDVDAERQEEQTQIEPEPKKETVEKDKIGLNIDPNLIDTSKAPLRTNSPPMYVYMSKDHTKYLLYPDYRAETGSRDGRPVYADTTISEYWGGFGGLMFKLEGLDPKDKIKDCIVVKPAYVPADKLNDSDFGPYEQLNKWEVIVPGLLRKK